MSNDELVSDDFEKDRQENKYLIPNIARALKVLEYLSRVVKEASIADISQEFNYPKNSVFRIIRTLEFYGYVEEHNRKYRATPRLLYLGYAGMRNLGITENSIDVMHELRDEVNETVMIGKMLGNSIVIIEQVPSFQFIKFTTEIGRQVPIYASAPGKAITAFLPEQEQDNILSHVTFTRYTDITIPSKSEMVKELSHVSEIGYAIDNGEELSEVHCVGAPIFDYRHYPVGAIWISGPSFRLDDERQAEIGEKVKIHALKISRRFGFDPGMF